MPDTTENTTGKKTAGAFDVRTIIGSLLGAYGVILVLTGIFADTGADKSGDVNSNLWAGIGLLVVSAAFMAWWKLRPIVVRPDTDEQGESEG